jgi:geranylgeranyl reductase family protein
MAHDVVIIGGGPVGCYAAYELAKSGFRILVLERNTSIGRKLTCTGIIGTEAFDRFQLPRGSVIRHLRDVVFVSPSGTRFLYQPPSPRAFVVDRPRFDSDLAELAQNHGAELRCNSLVEGIDVQEDGVRLMIRDSGTRVEILARMALIACGFNPELTERLGLGSPKQYLHAAQTEVEIEPTEEIEVHIGRDVAPGSFAWVVPIGRKRARIGVTTRDRADFHLRSLLKNPMIGPRINEDDAEIGTDLIPITPIRESFMRRILVVGEAAGQVKPTTGGGIFYGLISAKCATETVMEAFAKGRFEPEVLQKYEQSWRRELGEEIEIGYRTREVFSHIEDEAINRAFRILNSDGIAAFINDRALFDWHKDLILRLLNHSVFGQCFKLPSVLSSSLKFYDS